MAKKNSKKNKSDKKGNKSSLRRETKRSIAAIVCFTLAIISLLSFFGVAGVFGNNFYRISRLLLGRGFFLITVSLILVGLATATARFRPKEDRKVLLQPISFGIVIFIISVLGIFHLFAFPQNSFNQGLASLSVSGGGYFGLVLGYPLARFFGFWAGLVILAASAVISILVIFNMPLRFGRRKEEFPLDGKPEAPVTAETIKTNETQLEEKKGLFNRLKTKAIESMHRSNEETTVETAEEKENRKAPVEAVAVKNKPIFHNSDFKLPSLDFLEKDKGQPTSGDIKANINIIKRTLEQFGIEVEMAEVNVGPTVTQYTLRPAQGVKLSKIISLQNDLALALAAHPIRIEAPIPGRSLVGIEIPNKAMMAVRLKGLLADAFFQEGPTLLFALGRDVAGNPAYADLAKMPHMLVAGATGSGKTVALNNIITSLLYKNSPESMKLILIDPKRVELTAYENIPHLLSPVIIQPDKAIGALRWAVSEMERRFEVLRRAGKRDVGSYMAELAVQKSKQDKKKKKKEDEKDEGPEELPFIVVVVDELADLMSTHGREAEAAIVRLAQMSRAVGIHLIVSTQRPSVEVITGLIKANITSRIACQVASQIDSRTILDMAGAEKLLGNGDMLFLSGNSAKPKRIQGAYISDKEVGRVTEYLRGLREPEFEDEATIEQNDVIASPKRSGFNLDTMTVGNSSGDEASDELYGEAKTVVIQAKKASASLLQRRLRVGYARAARLLDILEEQGIVGPADGAKPREVFIDEGENNNF